MSTGTYARFDPSHLWYNAREEILFGSGKFILGAPDEATARRITLRWVNYLLSHPQGMAFETKRQGTHVTINLSFTGQQAIKRAGYSMNSLEILGMNTELKAAFLAAFETAIKEQL